MYYFYNQEKRELIFTWKKTDMEKQLWTAISHLETRMETAWDCGQEVLSSSSGSDTNQLNDLGQVI